MCFFKVAGRELFGGSVQYFKHQRTKIRRAELITQDGEVSSSISLVLQASSAS